jgi:diamine N-acetyltransferase
MNSELTLRAMEPEDLDLLYRIENDQQLWCLGVTNVPYSRYTLHDYIACSSGDIYTDRQVRLIIENGEHKTVGLIDLTNFDPKHLRAEIGIVIEVPMRRHGYATAAIDLLHQYAKSTLHLHQIFAIVGSGNTAARSLFRKHGYGESAHLKEWIYDGIAYHDAVVLQKIL